MDSRQFELPLRIILDIPVLRGKYSERIQQYNDNDLFEFLAVGSPSRFTEVKLDVENQSLWFERNLRGKLSREEYSFLYTEEMINKLASSGELKPEEFKLLFIAKTLAFNFRQKQKVIMCTQRKKLLNYRKYFITDLPEFTIFDPEEASLFIDLFCKKRDKYLIYPQHFTNKGLWYTYSMRAKMHQFHLAWSVNAYSRNPQNVDDRNVMEMMGSISNRMKDMLKAIDEIGMKYYTGSNNDTLADTIYHLNYWITLYSGILDALAWVSLYRYDIPVFNKNKVSIKNEDVLDELYKRNPKLREVLEKNQNIVNLVYDPRNMVIHRGTLKGLRLGNRQENFNFNMIEVDGEFLSHIRALQKVVPNGLNKAGLYDLRGRFLLEPYRFVRFATRCFIDFLNLYVSMLDYGEFLLRDEQLKQRIEEAAKNLPHNFNFNMTKFQDYALGY